MLKPEMNEGLKIKKCRASIDKLTYPKQPHKAQNLKNSNKTKISQR